MSSNNLVKRIRASKASGKSTAGSLSALPQVNDPTLQRWIKSISGMVEDGAVSFVRTKDLAKAGLIDGNGNISIPGQKGDDENSTVVPKAVVNLKASGGYSTVTLDWETPQSKIFGVNEVYRSEMDDFGKAVNIGSSIGDVYTDYIGNAAKVYYWVRTVSKYGVNGDLSTSVYAETSIDIDYVIDQLTGEISEGMLDPELKKDFDQIQVDLTNVEEAAELANNAAAAAQETANQAKNNATTAQTTANEAQTKANAALTSVSQEISDRKADITAIKSRIDAEVLALNNGITQEATYRQQGDNAQAANLTAYKTSNDAALGVVAQKAESAVTQSTANANNITTITATLNTKNRTYRQTAAPTENLVVGDLWVNTTAGKNNEQKRWNGSSWDDITDPRVPATATGLSTLQGTVSQQGNQITANTLAITQIDASIGDIEDDVSANNSAIASMRTDITKNGNDITSVANRMTAVENRVTTAEGKVTANTNAISGINTEITSIDGRTTANTNAITSLSGRMTTAENNINKKLDSSAIVNYYTKTEADAAAAGQISTYNAILVIGAENNIVNGDFSDGLNNWGNWGSGVTRNVENVKGKKYAHIVYGGGTIFTGILQGGIPLSVGQPHVISFIAFSEKPDQKLRVLLHQQGNGNNDPQIYLDSPVLTATPTLYEFTFVASNLESKSSFTFMLGGTGTAAYDIYVTEIMFQYGNKASAWVPNHKAEFAQVAANANAITTTNATVTAIDGRVTAAVNDITNLKSRVTTTENGLAQKADASALNAYSTTTQMNSAIASATTQLNANINTAINDITIGARNYLLDSKKSNTSKPISDDFDWTKLPLNTIIQMSFDIEIISPVSAGSKNRIGYELGISNASGGTSYIGVWFEPAAGKPVGKYRVVAAYKINALLTTNTKSFSFYNQTTGGNFKVTNVKLEIGSKPTDWSPAPEDIENQFSGVADAISSTNASVNIVDGRVTALSTQYTALNTKVDNNQANLQNNYYTKSDANSATSNNIAQYDASLTISSDNLIPTQLVAWGDGYWDAANGGSVPNNASYLRSRADAAIKVEANTKYVVKAVNTRIVILWYTSAGAYISYSEKKGNVTSQVITSPANAGEVRYYIYDPSYPRPSNLDQAVMDTYKMMVVKGESTKLDWIPSTIGLGQSLAGTATAIQNTNANVTAVDGRVTTVANQYTALNTKVDANQANLVNNYFTKTDTNTAISNATTTLKSEFGTSGGENIVWNGDASNGTTYWGANGGTVGTISAYTVPTSGSTYLRYQSANTALLFKGLVQQITVASGRLKAYTTYTLSFKATAGNSTSVGNFLRLIVHRVGSAGTNQISTTFGKLTWSDQYFTYTFNTNIADLTHINLIFYVDTGFAPDFMIREVQLAEGTIPTAYRKATADVVATATQDLVTTATMNSSIATATTALQASINAITVGGRNYLLASAAGANTKSISDDLDLTKLPTGTVIQMAFELNITSVISAGSRDRIGFEIGLNTVAGGAAYIGVWQTNVSGLAIGKYKVYSSYTIGSSLLASNPKTFPLYNQASGGAFTISNVKLEIGTKRTDWSAAPEDAASAAAFTQLDAKVSTVEGLVNTQSTQLTQLQTTQGNQQASINQQLQVINGMKALAMMQINNNGSVTGIGIASDMINGQVKSEIGFIADRFFFESPQGKVYPMIIDGNTTILNKALIKDGSIDNAKIGSLAADKITTGNIAADRMKANIVEAATGKFSSLSVLSANMGRFESVKSGVGRGVIEGPNIWLYDTVGINRIFIGLGD